ncbi:outer membrane protein N [Klebsiella pneumoniae]|uniref:Outer membrane protein N n=1 Tax=Klebsiella pneumoniae TaxID=573 RepID=A0A377U0R3_KLEPN|nr:outer membrane protein N [Klebsiella pneumoniae]
MKRKVLALMVPALLMASAANAAEIYNKNGNKLDLYGKLTACITSLTTLQRTATRPMFALV